VSDCGVWHVDEVTAWGWIVEIEGVDAVLDTLFHLSGESCDGIAGFAARKRLDVDRLTHARHGTAWAGSGHVAGIEILGDALDGLVVTVDGRPFGEVWREVSVDAQGEDRPFGEAVDFRVRRGIGIGAELVDFRAGFGDAGNERRFARSGDFKAVFDAAHEVSGEVFQYMKQ
jgi:hypothetical protein